MLDLGINNDSIAYEVAVEVLGQSRQPFLMAIEQERGKVQPAQALIAFCKAQLQAITILQEDLQVNDRETIERILNPRDDVFGPRPVSTEPLPSLGA